MSAVARDRHRSAHEDTHASGIHTASRTVKRGEADIPRSVPWEMGLEVAARPVDEVSTTTDAG